MGTRVNVTDAVNLIIIFVIATTSLEASELFTGFFKDYKVGLDANGKAEELNIDVELDVPVSGDNYLIRCLLVNKDDYENKEQDYPSQSYSRYNLNLKAGKQIITLHFDGYEIFKHKMNGPYVLTGLYFGRYLSSTPKDEYESLGERTAVYIPTLYRYTDFRHPDLSLRGGEATFVLKLGQAATVIGGTLGSKEVKLLSVNTGSVQIALSGIAKGNEFKLKIGEGIKFVMGGVEQTGQLQLLEVNRDTVKFKIKFSAASSAPEITQNMPIDIIYSQ